MGLRRRNSFRGNFHTRHGDDEFTEVKRAIALRSITIEPEDILTITARSVYIQCGEARRRAASSQKQRSTLIRMCT